MAQLPRREKEKGGPDSPGFRKYDGDEDEAKLPDASLQPPLAMREVEIAFFYLSLYCTLHFRK